MEKAPLQTQQRAKDRKGKGPVTAEGRILGSLNNVFSEEANSGQLKTLAAVYTCVRSHAHGMWYQIVFMSTLWHAMTCQAGLHHVFHVTTHAHKKWMQKIREKRRWG